jgi:hypothetical protein
MHRSISMYLNFSIFIEEDFNLLAFRGQVRVNRDAFHLTYS